MGYIDSTIRLRNQMTPVLNGIIHSMNMVVSTAYDMNRATGNAVDLTALNSARDRLKEIEAEINSASNSQSNFNNTLRDGADSANKLSNFIKSAVSAYVGIRGIRALKDLSDDMANIKVRLDMINDGSQTTKELQEQIFLSAQRARGEYQTTLDIVTKLGMQAKDAFSNNVETIAFAENLNKLFRISGTSAQGIESVMYNLTQAMGSGVLRGQDLNSVMANTPQIMKIVSDYMGVSVGEIRKLASEGELSAQVIKNALLGATDEINNQFSKMPLTFAQIGVDMKNKFIHALEPALQALNDFANSESFRSFVDNAISAMTFFASVIGNVIEYVVMFSNFIADNWSTLEPIIYGLGGAFLFWKMATMAQAFAMALLNFQLMVTPFGMLITAIGLVIASFVSWSRSIGGVRVGFAILGHTFLLIIRDIHLAFATFVSNVFKGLDKIVLGFHKAFNGVENAISSMKVLGLFLIEEFVNGAINGINNLINLVNSIPGVALPTIENVHFATEAKIKHHAEKQMRENELKEHENRVKANFEHEENYLKDLKSGYDKKSDKMLNDIANLINGKKEGNSIKANMPKFDIPSFDDMKGLMNDVKNATKGTEKNTNSLADGIKVKDDDISYLKDLAEIRAITNFSFEKIQVNVDNKFGDIHQTADLDGWVEGLTDSLTEAVNSTMGGVSSYGL